MPRTLFIESNGIESARAEWHRLPNVAELVVFKFTEGTDFHNNFQPTNADRAKALRDLPPHLRGVRADWFGESELPPGHCRNKCIEWAKLIHENTDGQGVEVVFLNNEENPKSDETFAEMNEDIAPVVPLSRAVCNWNDCIAGKAWWGPYSGKTIGGHSCPQSYEVGPLTTLWRWKSTIRQCVPRGGVVVHLPAMGKQIDAGNYLVDERTIYKRTESMIRYAVGLGVRHFVHAAYMLPDPWQAPYIAFCSWVLSDCDRLMPVEEVIV